MQAHPSSALFPPAKATMLCALESADPGCIPAARSSRICDQTSQPRWAVQAHPASGLPASGHHAVPHENGGPSHMNGASSHRASDSKDANGGNNLQHGAKALLHAGPNTGHRSHGCVPTSRKHAERLTSQLERLLGRGPLPGAPKCFDPWSLEYYAPCLHQISQM